MAEVLVVEDDEAIATLVADHLIHAGHAVRVVHDGHQALRAASAAVDLIVLDLMLPGISGIEICKSIRNSATVQPIILMLTAKTSEADVLLGYDAGADDYVRKPFGVRELLARIEALLRLARRQDGESDARLVFGDVVIDPGPRRVCVNDVEVKMTRMEFDLILYLARRPGIVISREQLLGDVWGYQHVGYARTVDSHVTRVRRKLKTAGLAHALIETVHANGYRLVDSATSDERQD